MVIAFNFIEGVLSDQKKWLKCEEQPVIKQHPSLAIN